ncbi:MAG TPA: apolipoprotein N-acyltransferase [Acidimicrobiaceae bacterium]|nr:apolipoprotein N-acyltransferase [Acidimicrobiaceae bacterium]
MTLPTLPLSKLWHRYLCSLGAGLLICGALPPLGWWPLAIIGVACWALLLEGQSTKQRFWIGAAVGFGWFFPSTIWMVTISPAGWPFGVAVWFPVVIGLTSMMCPTRSSWIVLPAALTLSEWVRWHAPFGGVPLSMLAITQGSGPLLPIARVLGTLGVSTAVAVAGVALAALTAPQTRRWGAALVAGLAALTVFGVLAPQGSAIRTIRAAAIQGGGEQRTVSALTDYSAVLQRHLDAARSIDGSVDLVVLPENIVNINGFFEGSIEQQKMRQLAIDLNTNLVAGVVEDRNDPKQFWNAAVSLDPDGNQLSRYDKVRRVPFGEYVPLRFLMEKVAADKIPRRDDKEGTGPALLDSKLGKLGTVISWEVFFPRRVRSAMDENASIMLNPTNGSSFWLTQVQSQQIASSSLRAVESGRWLVQAAPTGFSAIINPDGEVIQRTGLGEQHALVEEVELRTGSTLAMWWGEWPVLIFSLLVLAFALRAHRAKPGGELPLGPASESV